MTSLECLLASGSNTTLCYCTGQHIQIENVKHFMKQHQIQQNYNQIGYCFHIWFSYQIQTVYEHMHTYTINTTQLISDDRKNNNTNSILLSLYILFHYFIICSSTLVSLVSFICSNFISPCFIFHNFLLTVRNNTTIDLIEFNNQL